MIPENRPPEPRSACQANAQSATSPHESPQDRATQTFTCTLCGNRMFGIHCKLICSNCGYREDCSDLFRAE